MGTGSRVVSVLFRIGELCSAVIVVGLLGRFFYLAHLGNASTNGRLVYAEVISALEIVFSIILIIPAKYSFYAFPIDIIFFICSIVAFALLADVSTKRVCWRLADSFHSSIAIVLRHGTTPTGGSSGAGFG